MNWWWFIIILIVLSYYSFRLSFIWSLFNQIIINSCTQSAQINHWFIIYLDLYLSKKGFKIFLWDLISTWVISKLQNIINVNELTPLSDTLSSSILHLKQNRFSEFSAIFFLQKYFAINWKIFIKGHSAAREGLLRWLECHLLCGKIELRHHHQICTSCKNQLNNCTHIICKIYAIFEQFIASEWTAKKFLEWRENFLWCICEPMLHLNCQIGNPSRLLGNSLPKQG